MSEWLNTRRVTNISLDKEYDISKNIKHTVNKKNMGKMITSQSNHVIFITVSGANENVVGL